MQQCAKNVAVVGQNFGAAVAAWALAQAGATVAWFVGPNPVHEGGPGCPKWVPGGASLTTAALAEWLPGDAVAWTDGWTVVNAEGHQDSLDGDDLPAPFHLLPDLVGLSGLTAGQRMHLARGLVRLLQTQAEDIPAGQSLAEWLHAAGQNDPVLLAFWARLGWLATAQLPQNTPAVRGVAALNQALLAHNKTCRLGLIPEGGQAIQQAAQAFVTANGGTVHAHWPHAIATASDTEGDTGLALTASPQAAPEPLDHCIVTDPRQAPALLGQPAPSMPETPAAAAATNWCVRLATAHTHDATTDAPTQSQTHAQAFCLLQNSPVLWLCSMPTQAQPGVEGLVNPVWAQVDPCPDADTAIAQAKAAWLNLAKAQHTQAPAIKAAQAVACQPPAALTFPVSGEGPSHPSLHLINGEWHQAAGIVGEAAVQAALQTVEPILSAMGHPLPERLTPAAHAPTGTYAFLKG